MPRLMIAPLSGRSAPSSAAQSTIERMLLEEGVHIDHAASVQEALDRLSGLEHDLLILTHDDGDGGSRSLAEGVLALRTRAAQQGRHCLPVLVLTGAPEHVAAQEARSLGADDVLSLSPQLACSRVRAYLALSAASSVRTASAPPRSGSAPWRQDLTQRLVHDLRNPLAGLTSNLSYVDNRLGQGADPEVLEALADCRAAVGRLRRAATMLADLGPLEERTLQPRLQEAPVAPMFRDLLAQRLHEASLRQLSLVADVPPGHVAAFDPELLPRLLHALIDHALRYAQTGSRVLLSVVPRDRPGLTLRLEAPGEWLPRDGSGHLPGGMAEVGLALHYAHLVAQAHGGSIQVFDEAGPGQGRQTVALVTL